MKKLLILILFLFSACNNNSVETNSKFSHKSNKRAFAELHSSKIDFPYTFTAVIKSKVEQLSEQPKDSSPKVIEYTEKILLRRDQAGNFQGQRFLEDGDGIRFIFHNQTFCSGFRYEKYICRSEEKNELLRHRKNLWSSFTSSLKPIKHLLQKQKNKEKTAIYKIDQNNSSSQKKVFKAIGSLKILKSSGTIKTDTGKLPISSKFSWEALFSKDKKKFKITLNYEHEIKKTSLKIKLPDSKQVFPYKKRKRPLHLRKKLLGKKTPPTLKHIYKD